MTKQSFVRGAAILTLAGISVRIIGALFRIILAVLITDEGVGLYQMAYPVYSTLLAISTAGIPIAISKLVAENLAHDNYLGAYRVFQTAKRILALSGLVIFALMFWGAGYFVELFQLDSRAYLSLIGISPAIFFVSIMSAYRGFFQGQQQMLPTALSQVAEQLGRVAVATILVVIFLPQGLEYAAAGACFGAAAGAFFGLSLLLLAWWRQKKAFLTNVQCQSDSSSPAFWGTARRIFALAVPITLGSLVMPLINLVDLVFVPQRLQAAGLMKSEATALYGQLTGMAAPLVHIPTIITVALAISLVPAISEALALGRKRLLQSRAYLAVRVTLILGIPCAAGLYLLAEPICLLLFQNADAGSVLAVMSLGVIFLTLYQTTAAILQGLGKTMDPVLTLFWGALVKTALTWYLTALPQLHIRGAALATVVGFGISAILNLYYVQKYIGMPFYAEEAIFKPLTSAAVMGLGVLLLYRNTEARLLVTIPGWANHAATLVSIAGGVVIYVLMLLLLGGIKRSDLLLIPKVGPVVVRIAERFHLLRG
ncbi:MAG: polysaccharide biosynthesis protein [Firmicutes bacterium]|nr:polysaccharide biosynthesis protein [Bacillota bacterium]